MRKCSSHHILHHWTHVPSPYHVSIEKSPGYCWSSPSTENYPSHMRSLKPKIS